MVLLDLCFYMRAFLLVAVSGDWGLLSSCGEQVSHRRGFSCCGAWALRLRPQYLWCTGLVVAWLWDLPGSGVEPVFLEWENEVAQSCPTLYNPMDFNLPCSSIHGLFQARVLEWVAISFSRGTSQPRNRTWVSHIVGRCFTIWTTRWILNHWHTREVPILFLMGKPEPSNIIQSAFIWLNIQWRLKIFILKEKCRKSILFFSIGV